MQGTLARAVQGLLGTSSTRRHFFRLRWTADLNALVLSYTEEFPTETSAWRTVEWSERVRIHASSEELSCLTIVLKSSGALVHLRADAPADFVSWLANLQAALPSKPLLPIPHQSLKAFELHSPGMGRIQSTLTPRQVHGSVRRWHYARTAQCAKILEAHLDCASEQTVPQENLWRSGKVSAVVDTLVQDCCGYSRE